MEVINAHLLRCERLNPLLKAYLVLLHDSARQTAGAMETLFQAGVDLGPLQGVPVSVKDLIRMRGTRTTAGSRVLLQEPPDQKDAVVVQRLRAAGAVMIGKTNLHEFASGDPEPDGPFGLVQNPRRIGYYPGSSSSGAGAAAAAGLGVIAVGTDTGGSVRIPACLCGVAGLKPTTGRIPLEGVIPLSSTLDTVGFLARRVSDAGAALAVGADQAPPFSLEHLHQRVEGWRVGVPSGGFFSQMQPAVASAFEDTQRLLGDLGCQLRDFDPPGIEEMPELVATFIQAEGSAFHERYRGSEHLYGQSFRDRVLKGREIKALTFIMARQRQLELQEKWLQLGGQYDLLIFPSGPALAPPHGATAIEVGGEPFPFRALLAHFTRPFNLLGWPALSVPNGVSAEGLPTGVQIVGPPDTESRLLALGHQLEQALGLVAKLTIEPKISA